MAQTIPEPPDFDRARRAMIEGQLRTNGITSRPLLAAMGRVPRELFVPEAQRALAYIDDALPLSARPDGRRLAPAGAFGRLVQLARVGSADAVLDVGCGTGYSAAVLAALAGTVVAIDDDAELVAAANRNFAALGIGNARALVAGPDAGAPAEGPFDVIVVEGSVGEVPRALLDQLADGGRLVAAVGRDAAPSAELVLRAGSDFAVRREFNLNLPPLTAPHEAPAFVF